VIDAVYRAESRCVLATLIRLLGGFELAEEALHEAFAAAVEQWPREGMPANPRAWLISTGRFKAIDAMRRRARFDASRVEIAERLEAEDSAQVLIAGAGRVGRRGERPRSLPVRATPRRRPGCANRARVLDRGHQAQASSTARARQHVDVGREAVFEWRAGQEGGSEGAEAEFAAMCGTDAATYHRDRPGMSAFALAPAAEPRQTLIMMATLPGERPAARTPVRPLSPGPERYDRTEH